MNSMLRTLVVIVGALGAAATAASPRSRTEQEVLLTVQALIDSWREADVPKAASVLHESYRLVSLQASGEGSRVFVDTRDGLLKAISKLHKNQWDVRLNKSTVTVDPNGMAIVWTSYEFFSDGKANHCGRELYTLFHFQSGWKVVSFADTDTALDGRRASEVCPD